jgi:hypothetical protein
VIVSSNGLGGGIENRDGQVIVHATPEEAYLQLELKHAHLRQYEHEVLPALLGSIEDSTRPLLDLPPASYPSEES